MWEELEMEMIFLDEQCKKDWQHQILTLCRNSDQEFIPPLSQRSSTTQGNLIGGGENGIDAYCTEVLRQPILACIEGDMLLGFVSFKENYTPEHYPDTKLPNIYISTLILSPESRGKGLTKKLYTYLFTERFPNRSIYTRTWSTNAAHLKILRNFGFSEILCIPNHRGIGIDTVYYGLEREK